MGGVTRPAAGDVAERAFILKHVVVYALTAPPREMLAEMMRDWPDDERNAFRDEGGEMRDDFWTHLGPLGERLSPWERELSRTTVLTMSASQQVDASWRMEAFQVLLWALGLVSDLPDLDTQADHDLLKGFPPSETFVQDASLIAADEVDRAREVVELWHWRSRTRQLQERGDAFPVSPEFRAAGLTSYDDVVRSTAKSARDSGELASSLDEDFAVFGKPYRDLSADQWSIVRSVTVERHFALNWLCGRAPANRWDETPTDT